MTKEVVVTRRGQTTTPNSIRKKLGIHEGTRLMVVAEGEKVVLRKIPSIFDFAGQSKLTTGEAFKLLDRMREAEA
ncbi:MAG: AbrB/MazE/SpoVT family DNA-binding domain-containing protein [Thaumarchaeota archaeon]|nr:AbrB/MazE/SpoVT family DNA-binding domain-containing protein [Nitrososphaerota archaeon]